jgi:hypothetical protein
MSAEAKEVAFAPSTNGDNGSTGRASVTEIFHWRVNGEGKPPEEIVVYPYVWGGNDNRKLTLQVEEANARLSSLSEQRNKLANKRDQLDTDLFIADMEGAPNAQELSDNLKAVSERLAKVESQLAQTPSGWYVMAESFFCRVIKSWGIVVDGEPVPIEPAAIAALDSIFLITLRDDLQSFLATAKRKKK